jgi:hypothetical protein
MAVIEHLARFLLAAILFCFLTCVRLIEVIPALATTVGQYSVGAGGMAFAGWMEDLPGDTEGWKIVKIVPLLPLYVLIFAILAVLGACIGVVITCVWFVEETVGSVALIASEVWDTTPVAPPYSH